MISGAVMLRTCAGAVQDCMRSLQLATGSRERSSPTSGDWKSGAFLAYLDRVALERDQVIEAQTGFSDSEDEDDGLRASGGS